MLKIALKVVSKMLNFPSLTVQMYSKCANKKQQKIQKNKCKQGKKHAETRKRKLCNKNDAQNIFRGKGKKEKESEKEGGRIDEKKEERKEERKETERKLYWEIGLPPPANNLCYALG